jgi:hypothetical protein
MTSSLADILDVALERLRIGESAPAILADHPAHADALAALLAAAAALDLIRPVEMPAPAALAADRSLFLTRIDMATSQPVSSTPLIRLTSWIAHLIPWQPTGPIIQRKEQRRMSILLVRATLIFSMVFGSAGGAAALVTTSLPDSPIYPAKLALEQVRLSVTANRAEQALVHLDLAQARVREMQRMALAGEAPDEGILSRLENHLDRVLNLAAQVPEDAMLGLLSQAQTRIQSQEQELSQVQAQVAESDQEPLRQASRLLDRARQEAQAGLQDPESFRQRHTEGGPPEPPPQPTVTPTPSGNPDCPSGDCQPPGDQHRRGPQPDQPGPGDPGGSPDCPSGDCQPPGDQNRDAPQADQPGHAEDCVNYQPEGDQNQHGPQPDQPGSGEPGGNPDGDCTDCQPEGDQHQYGPQPDQPGPGEPAGNPDGDCTDCQPQGDEHHHDQESTQPSDASDSTHQGGSGGGDGDSGSDGGHGGKNH